MAEPNYIPNSKKYKNEQKEVIEHRAEKVTTGAVTLKKKGSFSKFLDMFLPEGVTDTKHYITYDVIIPEIKKTILDVIRGLMYGSKGEPTVGSHKIDHVSFGGHTNYQAYSSSPKTGAYSSDTKTYQNPIYANRGDAELVLNQMLGILEEYGNVSINDMLDLVGITGEYVDAKYGWYDLRNARVIPVSGGYMIELPKAVALLE